MKNSKFSDSQIMEALKRVEAGLTVPELCREVRQSLTGDDVAMVLTEIAQSCELPSRIQADNGPEFIWISGPTITG